MEKKTEKKRVIKNIDTISDEVKEAIRAKYPDGWGNHVLRVNKGNNEFFHVITIDTEDTSYMIRVNVKVDSVEELEKLENQDSGGGSEDDDDDTIAGGEEDIQDISDED
ncbi:MAG TPA: hypothetical protein VFC92_07605 [Bacteroidales bacterium]|nr:hypothetical protein [Bacteroidales bacterium]